jgi:hypothetical protein
MIALLALLTLAHAAPWWDANHTFAQAQATKPEHCQTGRSRHVNRGTLLISCENKTHSLHLGFDEHGPQRLRSVAMLSNSRKHAAVCHQLKLHVLDQSDKLGARVRRRPNVWEFTTLDRTVQYAHDPSTGDCMMIFTKTRHTLP